MKREWGITENSDSSFSERVPDKMADVPSPPEMALAHLLIDRKRAESMLSMLKGNTEPDDIEKLRREWLNPILDRLLDLQLQVDKEKRSSAVFRGDWQLTIQRIATAAARGAERRVVVGGALEDHIDRSE
jgi:hypothetical protein